MPTRVRSHAKINLGLGIGAPRSDGFHALTTVYQTLELHDVVTVEARPAGETTIQLTSNDERVPTDERNTAWKMVSLALEDRGMGAAVAIHIEKRLPIQGGLGAGSANAVAALVGLEAEIKNQRSGFGGQESGVGGFTPFEQRALERWGTLGRAEGSGATASSAQDDSRGRPDKSGEWGARRLELAARVGSDVPLFLIGGTVLGVDRGQAVTALPDLSPTWCVVATPEVGVSTPQAFSDWDALCVREGLTPGASEAKLKELSHAYASAFSGAIPRRGQGAGSSGVLSSGEDLAGPIESALVRTGISSWIQNDFERVVFPQHPSLAEIKRILAASETPEAAHPYSALAASLSGSGSALYGLYAARGDAEAAQARLTEMKVQSMLTRTIPRLAYWSEMLL